MTAILVIHHSPWLGEENNLWHRSSLFIFLRYFKLYFSFHFLKVNQFIHGNLAWSMKFMLCSFFPFTISEENQYLFSLEHGCSYRVLGTKTPCLFMINKRAIMRLAVFEISWMGTDMLNWLFQFLIIFDLLYFLSN